MNRLPTEIILIISRYAHDFKAIYNTFGLRLSRQEIYKLFWPQVYVPTPGVIMILISWKINEEKGRNIDVSGMMWFDSQCQVHRDFDRPASIHNNGCKVWYTHSLIHRDFDRPALIMTTDNKYIWFMKNQMHREKGPAVVSDNGYSWYRNDTYLDFKSDYNSNNTHACNYCWGWSCVCDKL